MSPQPRCRKTGWRLAALLAALLAAGSFTPGAALPEFLPAIGTAVAQEPVPPPPRRGALGETSQEVYGRIVGRLADDDTGRPISGAVLALSPGGATTLSDSTGAFALPPVPPGAYRLEIRHIAYGTRTVDVEVRPRRASYLDLRIPPEAVALEPLEVEVEWRPRFLEEVGFYDRRERGWGTFFDPEFVERWSQGVTSLGQFLDRMTGHYGTFHNQRIAHEGAPASLCPTGVPIYIDGHLDQQGLFAELSPAEVGAVEVYYDSHGVPGFALADQWPCLGAVAIWTKRWVDRGEAVGGEPVTLCEPEGGGDAVTVEGTVRDELTGVPLPGATVVAEAEGGAGDGGSGGAREGITVRTDRRGRYRLCDLPSARAVRLRASYRDHEGAPVEVFETLATSEAEAGDETSRAAGGGSGRGSARRVGHDLSVPVAEPGRLVGRILDRETGRPVTSADVAVHSEGDARGSVRRAQTDEEGYFAVAGLAPGDHAVEVRHVGYDELSDSVSVLPIRTSEFRAELSPRPLDLEPLVVTAIRDRRLEARGFYQRRDWGERTGRGFFLEGADIRALNSVRVSHMVRDAPGVRVECSGGRGCVVRPARAGGCPTLNVFVDGARVIDAGRSRADRTSVDELVSPADVAAVEVYPGATSLPGEFAGSRGRCGALVVWTR